MLAHAGSRRGNLGAGMRAGTRGWGRDAMQGWDTRLGCLELPPPPISSELQPSPFWAAGG